MRNVVKWQMCICGQEVRRMKLIRKIYDEREGGNCVNCGNDFHAKNKEVWLAKFLAKGRYIQEPFSLCKGCIRLMKRENR